MKSIFSLFAIRYSLFFLAALAGAPPASAAGPRLILISFDGLRPDAISEERSPNLAELRAAGVQAVNAINDLPSVTMTNHATMLTGQVADAHAVIWDFELPGRIAWPTLFEFARDAGLRSAFFASKSKLIYFAKPEALEVIDIDGDQNALVDRLLAQITPDGPDLIFLHLRDPDSTGHAQGWMSEPYLQAVAWDDELLGRIRSAVAADTARPTYWILTADHGGDGDNHFLNVDWNRKIPWIVVGPGIPAGGVLEQPVSVADTTPTALWLLGVVEPPPGLAGRVVTAVKDPAIQLPLPSTLIAPMGIPCLIWFTPLLFGCGWWAARAKNR